MAGAMAAARAPLEVAGIFGPDTKDLKERLQFADTKPDANIAQYKQFYHRLDQWLGDFQANNKRGPKTPELMEGIHSFAWDAWQRGGLQVRRGGEGGVLNQAAAMYRSPKSDVAQYVSDVLENPSAKKSYFDYGQVPGGAAEKAMEDVDENIGNARVVLPSDIVNHGARRHPDITPERWRDLLSDMDHPDEVFHADPRRVSYGGTPLTFVSYHDGKGTVVVAEHAMGNKGDRLVVKTYFTDTEKGVKDWVEREKARTNPDEGLGAGGSPAYPSPTPKGGDVTPDTPSDIKNILPGDEEVKPELKQTAYHGSPYRKLAGEIEARDASARGELTAEERAKTPPYSSENIHPNDAILLQRNLFDRAREIGRRITGELQAWGQKVDDFVAGKFKRTGPLEVGTTPEALQKVGAKELPMTIDPSVLAKIFQKHSLSPDIVKDIPRMLAEPLAIFESSTVANSRVVLTEAKDADGHPVLVAVHLDVTERGSQINETASAYGKENFEGWVKKQIADRNVRYVDRNKIAAIKTSNSQAAAFSNAV